MKIRSFFFLTIIAAILGMVIACGGGGHDEYTVRFEANGGYPAPQSQTVSSGGYITEPAPMTKTGYGFVDWYKEETFINLWNFTTDVVTGNITLYAKWDNFNTNYTVKFEANGGSPAPQNQTISYGGKVTEPAYMTKVNYGFAGWYKEATLNSLWNFNYDTVTRDITLYAKWEQPVNVQGTTLTEKLQWLNSNAESNSFYILEVSEDEFLGPQTLSYNDIINATSGYNIYIQLIGIGGVKNIELYGTGSLFTIGNGVTLILDENIVLKGTSRVYVWSGNLILNNGSKITGNLFSNLDGGGVLVNGGTFTMNGGEISGNAAYSGGGVYISNGTFTMNGGEISGNTAGGGVYVSNGTFTMTGGEISGNTAGNYGGGVYVNGGTFTMTGGKISGNTASNYYGGGVYISNGTFTMIGGEISGNTASSSYSSSSSYGGGVHISNGTFTMTGGEISGNTASSYGGGVYVDGTFAMTGGEISGNTAYSGGGVYVDGTFAMTGGEISGNTASSYVGGVYVSGSIEKTGGIITGYSSDTVNGNVVKRNNVVQGNGGHAVYVAHNDSRFVRRKETTAGQSDNLIYIRNEPNPPTISGAWDTDD